MFFNIPNTVRDIAVKLKNEGYQCYLVGGAVRDTLIGLSPTEYDLATDAHPSVVQKIFKHTIPTGIKHGTVLVILNGMHVEVTTFRSDGDYSDGRRPDSVQYAKTIEEDLLRRDFTINAMAYDILSDNLIDLFDGKNDLKNKIVRAVRNPIERFNEDGLRLMRAIRFATKLEFEIEPETFAALKDRNSMLSHVAYERIREEFNGILLSDNPFRGMEIMRVTGILDLILPELVVCYGVEQNKYHKYDVYYHILHTLQAVEKIDSKEQTLILKLSALFHDIAKPIVQKNVTKKEEPVYYNHEVVGAGVARRVMKRFKYSNNEIDSVLLLVKQHMFYYQDEWTDGAVRRFMRSVGLENIKPLLKLREADRIGSGKRKDKESRAIPKLMNRIEKQIEAENAITVKDLHINGSDLMTQFELRPSRFVGELLNYLLELILDDPSLNEYDMLLNMSKQYIEESKKNTEVCSDK